ncbi:hypothetical protein DRN75_03845 [Nanoarchaeota archaeon]|nr:MAG: hypothetical protein DRN75_03845 [Nanoarchaeota archaeon]
MAWRKRNKTIYGEGREWQFIQDLNIGFGGKLELRDLNKYNCWNPEEDFEHRITKWMVFDILTKRGHKVLVEGQLGGGIFDILDCSTQTIYEIEQKRSEKIREKKLKQFNSFLIKDIVFVYIKELPRNLRKRYKELEEKL